MRPNKTPLSLRQSVFVTKESLVKVSKHALDSGHIQSGEEVLVVADTISSRRFLDIFMEVAHSRGILAQLIIIPYTPEVYDMYNYYSYTPPKPVLNAMMGADVIYGMTKGLLASWYSYHYYPKILEKSRVLFMSSQEDRLANRMQPGLDIKRISRKGTLIQEMIKKTDKIRVTSKEGTNVLIEGIRHSADLVDRGEVFKPGEECHVFGGNYYAATEKESITGVIVLDDYEPKLLGVIEEPIKLTIKNDKIIKITGGRQAKLLESYIKELNDPNFPYVIHIGFGTHPLIKHGEGVNGALIWGIGKQEWFFETREQLYSKDKGQTAKNHFDPTTLNATVWLDDALLIKNQKWIPKELQ